MKFIWHFLTSLLLFVLVFSIIYFPVRSIFQTQTLENLFIINESKTGQFNLFLEKIKIRTADWSSDGKIRNLTEEISRGGCSSILVFNDCFLVTDLSSHLKNKKLPLDPKIAIADILDANGIVIASSDSGRIGKNEGAENPSFEIAKQSSFGQTAMADKFIFETRDSIVKPMISVASPLVGLENNNLAGVLIIYVISDEISDLVRIVQGRTMETYLVNNDKLMITPSRILKDSVLKQIVNTPPVKSCLNDKKDFNGVYLNYYGQQVFGASHCLPANLGVLITELGSSEIFLTTSELRKIIMYNLLVVLIFAATILFIEKRYF